MRIETITLSWFRGAAEQAVLDTGSKSVVVYGATGSGKSTFADAIEYLVQNGRIEHLAHEYSGSKQEKGVCNTHTPPNGATRIAVQFKEGGSVRADIAPDGRLRLVCDPAELQLVVQDWEIKRLILRQDEVADFVHATKGEKYSALLPLLGLDALETAAENLRQLEQRIRSRSQLAEKEQTLEYVSGAATTHLPDLAEGKVVESLKRIARTYLRDAPKELPALTSALAADIDSRIRSAEPEIKRHMLLTQIQGEDVAKKLEAMTEAEAATKGEVDALLDRRIAVLEGTQAFVTELSGDEEEVNCPACGRSIAAAELAQHVRGELTGLERARSARTAARQARQVLGVSLGQVLKNAEEPELCQWLNLLAQKDFMEALDKLKQVHLDRWEEGWLAEELQTFNSCVPLLTAHVQRAINDAPPSTQELIGYQQIVGAAASIPEIKGLKMEIEGINDIIDALVAGETAVRAAIKTRTTIIINSISGEVQRLWSKLHPDEPIENIHLHIPRDADKAIDIGLRFFGVDQPSPRLTLSEGHRNSLGLCIFLALVGRGKVEDRPIILDDIVSSLDRGHRGMVDNLLLEDLADRQVMLFTHDREWFAELRARLPSSRWKFMALRPWESPDVGLRWSASTDTFDDARALIALKPEAAGNCARAIMDTELAVAAEKLFIPMPFLRGDRNDHRTAVYFLEHIISEAGNRLKKQEGESWTQWPGPISEWREVRNLLISWANRASHAGTLTDTEADLLIKACERALSYFRCITCGDPIWIADQVTRERLQCRCGEIQWRYG